MPKKKLRYSFVSLLHEQLLANIHITKKNTVKLTRSDLKAIVDDIFLAGIKTAVSGQRASFPIIGAISRKNVKARRAGKGINPFTKEPMEIKARAAFKKPRWSFPKTVKESFMSKRGS